jgi:hypothetical protein
MLCAGGGAFQSPANRLVGLVQNLLDKTINSSLKWN